MSGVMFLASLTDRDGGAWGKGRGSGRRHLQSADDRALTGRLDKDGVIARGDGGDDEDGGRAVPGSDDLPCLDDVGVAQGAPGILAGGDIGPCLIRKAHDVNQVGIPDLTLVEGDLEEVPFPPGALTTTVDGLVDRAWRMAVSIACFADPMAWCVPETTSWGV